MTKEEILKAFTADELFAIKSGLSEEQIASLKFSNKSNSKLVEVIKIAIDGIVREESEGIVTRKIQISLNK